MLNEIVKGMDNAAEQIDQNFNSLRAGEDVKHRFTLTGQGEIKQARLFGDLLFINIQVPLSTSWETYVQSDFTADFDSALSVSFASGADVTKGSSIYFNIDGSIQGHVSTSMSGQARITGFVLVN